MSAAEPELRPYQDRDVAAIRAAFAAGYSRVLYQGPTGSGKTVLFAYIIANAVAAGNRVLILGHRDEIVRQISEALAALGVAHGIIAAGYPKTPGPVQVASVATLVRRLDRLQPPDLIIIDEAHHAVAGTWRRILDAFPESRVLGVTATPERLDGKGLGDIFDTLVLGPTVAELIEADFLSRFTAFAPARSPDLSNVKTRAGDFAVDQLADAMSKGVVIDGAVTEYTRLCPGAPAIAFCVDIEHSKLIAERFKVGGYRAAHLDGDTPTAERRELIAALGGGELQVLANCGLISEGLDVPTVTAAILLRPTKSLALYLQQVGRALRPAPGKERALILDHSGNTFRFGPVDAPRNWSLDGREKSSNKFDTVRRCPSCGAINPLTAFTCEECGATLREAAQPKPKHEIRTGPLVEVNRVAAMPYGQVLRWAGSDEQRLRLVAMARGYKRGWVWHRLQELRQTGAA